MGEERRYSWLDLLGQTEIWVPADGVPIPIKQMGRRHAANTVAMLLRLAPRIHMAEYFSMSQFASTLNGEMAQDAADRALDEMLEHMGKEAAWLAKEPLLQALTQQAIDGPDDEPRPQAHHIEEVSF